MYFAFKLFRGSQLSVEETGVTGKIALTCHKTLTKFITYQQACIEKTW